MPSVDFAQLIDELARAPVCTKENLSIWGGEFKADCVDDFLDAWKSGSQGMPWHIWEWVSQIVFQCETWPERTELLERGRLFGPGGDLSLRRDGKRFLWRFVGPRQEALPEGFEWDEGRGDEAETKKPFLVADYWREHSAGWELQVLDHSVLLWGQERLIEQQDGIKKSIWTEDRVGGVKDSLVYPTMSGKDKDGRIQLCYREYLHGGDIEAVWWLGLTGWNEPCEEESHE